MASAQPAFKFTYEDYRTAPPDRRYELLDGETVWVHRLRNGELEVAHTFARGHTLRSPLLPGFALDVDNIFGS